MAQTAEQISEEEEFEFRRRFEMEQEGNAPQLQQTSPEATQPKSEQGFWDEHPNLRTAMRYGLPLAAAGATIPLTGGMSLPMILATEGLASLGSETVNQAIGVNEHDPNQLALAMAAPGIGRSVGGILANIPRAIPGFGDALRAALTPEMRALPGKLLGGKSSADLYKQLGQQAGPNQRITQLPELKQAIHDLETQSSNMPWEALQQKLKTSGHSELFDQIKQSIHGIQPTVGMTTPTVGGKHLKMSGLPSSMNVVKQGRPAGLDFNEARAAIEGLGKVIGSTSDDAERGVYKKLYSSLLSDLEKAPTPASGDLRLWKEARHAFKMEKAKFALQEATEKAIKVKDGVELIDANQIVKWLNTNKEIKSRVSPPEFRAIKNEYRMMASMAGHNMSKFTAMLVGGFATGGAGGALAGYLGAESLAKVMMTEAGRKVVRSLVGDPSRSNFRRFMMIAGTEARAKIGSSAEGDSIPVKQGEE